VITETLALLHDARPFRPFTILLSNGSRYPVPAPSHLAYAARARVAVVLDVFGVPHYIDLSQVTEVSLDPL
jgi:hypothetical protein